jgi:glutamate synthase (NADPH/NADH) small chain
MHCLNPRCQEQGCPLGSDIPAWVNLAYHHRWDEACKLLHQANNFPEFTAAICPAPCRLACKQSANERPVNIRQLELEIVERGFAAGTLQPQKPSRTSGRKVAVIGSGPAGLAAAQQLARAGHQVTVFEKDPAPGGLLRYGVPHFRLDKALIDRRVAQLQAEGVSFACGKTLGKDIEAAQLRRQFDAVLIATGSAQPRDLNLPGRNLPGVHLALDYLRRHNLAASSGGPAPAELDARGKTVVVLGGGETGQDCVDFALAGGAREVYQLEILPQDRLAAPAGHASEPPAPSPDGAGKSAPVHKRYSVATQAFCGDNGHLTRLRAVEVAWRQQAGRPAMTQKPGAEFELKADMALLALGYEPKADPVVLEQFGLQADARGRIAADDFATAQAGVFVAGDTAVGPSQVARAIQTGRRAAERIDRYLRSL